MTDRDTFAAAALTGLLVHANDSIDEETLDTPSDIAYTAYQMADAMLRERDRTNHTPVTEPMAKEKRAEVSAVLTDAEREAVRFAATAALPETEKLGGVAGELCRMHAATLRGLLERLK